MNFKKYIKVTMVILLVIGVVILALGIVKWSENVYTGIIYLVIGVIQFLGSILLLPRIAKLEDQKEVGNRAVQANWLVLSIGIAGMALFMAPFFRLEAMIVPYIAFVLCVVSVLLSGINIYTAVKKVKARMVV